MSPDAQPKLALCEPSLLDALIPLGFLINPIVSLIYGFTITHIPPNGEEPTAGADAETLERAMVAIEISR